MIVFLNSYIALLSLSAKSLLGLCLPSLEKSSFLFSSGYFSAPVVALLIAYTSCTLRLEHVTFPLRSPRM